ncbi:carbohydrate kinase family protein [Gracilimonas mengyeensis]|uniref:Fructokinase n=1 Tax=Gracilimonas mengyeensis TaxID=1302730 RepID=A0A521DHQ8_9BACT|nr:carbohydrate kinase [Gracilimonas mengyeensis]SMO71176.1 fructokinase [Gracilimonas mengyeensis]
MNNDAHQIICFGEILWDRLPSGIHLGGAPLNVAVHAHQLGMQAEIISAVGDDELGEKALQAIRSKGVSTDFIAYSSLPTGTVDVDIDQEGNADYTIHMPAAWDDISWYQVLKEPIRQAEILVFGTLAFRNEITRNTLLKALQICEGKAVVDVNFRKPFYDELLLDEVLTRADIAKINEEELKQILIWKQKDFNHKQLLEFLTDLYELELILLSRGVEGSAIFYDRQYTEQDAFSIQVADTVGAGDAFLAGAIHAYLEGKPPPEILTFANAMGALVAGKEGATPSINPDQVRSLIENS